MTETMPPMMTLGQGIHDLIQCFSPALLTFLTCFHSKKVKCHVGWIKMQLNGELIVHVCKWERTQSLVTSDHWMRPGFVACSIDFVTLKHLVPTEEPLTQ